MKTAVELCKQIEQDKIDEHRGSLASVIKCIRDNEGEATFQREAYSYFVGWRYRQAVRHKEELINLGYKVKEFKDTRNAFVRFFCGKSDSITISACCGSEL